LCQNKPKRAGWARFRDTYDYTPTKEDAQMDIDPWGHEPEGNGIELLALVIGMAVAVGLLICVVEAAQWLV
jgi:hypothetical protein